MWRGAEGVETDAEVVDGAGDFELVVVEDGFGGVVAARGRGGEGEGEGSRVSVRDKREGGGLKVDEDGLVGYGVHESVAAGAVGHDDEHDVRVVVFGFF